LTATAACPKVDVVALCDIDESKEHLGRAAEKFSKAKTYVDWRRLMDDSKSFDAAIVSTPDHMQRRSPCRRCNWASMCSARKPLTHTVHEARQMRLAATKYHLVTQMGNQIQSHPAYRTAVRLVQAAAIGKVARSAFLAERRLWAGSWRTIGQRAARRRRRRFTGTSGWAWRRRGPDLPKPHHRSIGGRGRISRMASSAISAATSSTGFHGVETDTAADVLRRAPPINREVWTKSSTVSYAFPGTEFTAGTSVKVTWYDALAVFRRERRLGLPEKAALPGSGSVLIGERARC
jgi:predicted dehydrogenase